MTAPVLVRIIPGQGPACKDDFRMSFYVAPKVTDPPKPTNPNVTLSSLPAQTVYIRYCHEFSFPHVQLRIGGLETKNILTLFQHTAVADPGFPIPGATPKFGVKTYYLTRFLLITA